MYPINIFIMYPNSIRSSYIYTHHILHYIYIHTQYYIYIHPQSYHYMYICIYIYMDYLYIIHTIPHNYPWTSAIFRVLQTFFIQQALEVGSRCPICRRHVKHIETGWGNPGTWKNGWVLQAPTFSKGFNIWFNCEREWKQWRPWQLPGVSWRFNYKQRTLDISQLGIL